MSRRVPKVRDQTNLFERDVRTSIAENNAMPLSGARLIKNVALTTATTKVAHGLGRIPTGWWVVDTTTTATVRRSATVTTELTTFLHLVASAATTVNIIVF